MRNSLQNIETLTSDQGKLGQSLNHLAELTGPDGSLSKTFKNTEKFTSELTENNNAAATAHAIFVRHSDNLNKALTRIGQQFSVIGGNLEEASDAVKRQPPGDSSGSRRPRNCAEPAANPTPNPRASPTPSPTPKKKAAGR